MPTLTLKTAVDLANQAYANLGFKYPWSFVAVPAPTANHLKLRVIRADEGLEREAVVSHGFIGVHGFSNACTRAIRDLSKDLRDEIVTKRWKITA